LLVIGAGIATTISIETLEEQIARLLGENSYQKEKIRFLEEKIDALVKRLFGASSERYLLEHPELTLDGELLGKPDPSAGASAPEEAQESGKTKAAKRGKRGSRLAGMDKLTVVSEEITPAEVLANPDAFERMSAENDEVTRLLSFIPAKCYVKETRRPKYRNTAERHLPPVVSPAPITPLVGGIAGADLLSQIILWKYVDHLPLYRITQILQRAGVHVPRDLSCGWVMKTAKLLEPLHEVIAKEVLQSSYLQADETPIDYLSPGNGKTKTGYFWIINHPIATGSVIYHWRTGRGACHLDDILGKNFKGTLQCDGYSSYVSYSRRYTGVDLGGCMAHVRRKFFEAHQADSRNAGYFLHLITLLYEIERRLREANASAAIREKTRAHESRPIIERMHRAMVRLRLSGFGKDKFTLAINYALGQWSGIVRYLEDGRMEIDNNLTENAVRPLKLGAKNWLFIGSERAGHQAAVIYTLVENCKRHGLDVARYLEQVILQLAEHGPDIAAEITPAKVAAARNGGLRKKAIA
jgi:transposase